MAALEALAIALAGAALWLAGTVVFDAVHALLHAMLRSRWALLRALAWPHAVHHHWLDRELRTNWAFQGPNVFCHLIPEYLTQLAFSAALLQVLPAAPVWVCIGLQTLVFAYLLSQRGLDVNHRAREIVDAYRPSFVCPPDYHALHHLFPDAYYSAYTKLVDQVAGSAAWLRDRRCALHGADTPLGRALAEEALRGGSAAEVRAIERPEEAARADLDLLLLCDAAASPVPFVEAFAHATRQRLLPPEVWALHARADDPTARHYARDVRVSYRVLHAPGAASLDGGAARRAARRALLLARRGGHFLPLRGLAEAWRAWRRFRATAPERPEAVPDVPSRRACASA